MKKLIIGFSGILILVVAVLLFTNAQNSAKDVKKAATEVKKDCSKCPSSADCTSKTETKASCCDMSKSKDAKCDMTKCKEAKCDPATCKMKSADVKDDMKSCDPTKCKMKTPTK
jgi:hypothetical protein